MDATRESEPAPMKNRTTVERKSERELVVTRTFNGPARLVFEAWTKPELFRQWWVPKSMGMSLLSCEMDVRVGGRYRLEFAHGDSQAAFFGTYKEVTPHSRLVWTNEESDEGSVTTVTFAEKGGKTLLVMHELYPSKEALDAAGTGAADAMGETFEQLDELLVTLGASEDGHEVVDRRRPDVICRVTVLRIEAPRRVSWTRRSGRQVVWIFATARWCRPTPRPLRPCHPGTRDWSPRSRRDASRSLAVRGAPREDPPAREPVVRGRPRPREWIVGKAVDEGPSG